MLEVAKGQHILLFIVDVSYLHSQSIVLAWIDVNRDTLTT